VTIFENSLIFVELHDSEIPWLKIFTKEPHKELSECDGAIRKALFDAALLIEEEMLIYFKPEKINWASFGNMLPRVHIHIQARFKEDSCFPEPMWGAKQREFAAQFPPLNPFLESLAQKMHKLFQQN
jgi:diadenosine tetraphosphate (Ap4A) HIT family hydrolase